MTFAKYAKEPGLIENGKLVALDVICGKDYMTVRAEFSSPFNGMVFSKGTYGQEDCMYVRPNSQLSHATFKVYYNSCGTKPDLKGKYYENTIVVQYGKDIIEAYDEAKRLRCEWFEAYEKSATFRPAIPVADLDAVEMNFNGDDIDCWINIVEGQGPWGNEVSRIVPVGQPMTIKISIFDTSNQFDMKVKSCYAHDGVKSPIQLTDEYGCVIRTKMLTPFMKTKDPSGKATVVSYSNFYAFKFPDTTNVQIQCTVEVCRHGCSEACSKEPYQTLNKVDVSSQVASAAFPRTSPSSEDNDQSNSHKTDEQEISAFDIKRAASSHSLSQLPFPQALQENHQVQNIDLQKLPVPKYDPNLHFLEVSKTGHSEITRTSKDSSTESEIILNTGNIESIKEAENKNIQPEVTAKSELYLPLSSQLPLPQFPLPQSPLPQSPLPQSPLPQSPLSQSPLPHSQLPPSPLSPPSSPSSPQLSSLPMLSFNNLQVAKVNQAEKILKDLGVSADMASFATSLVNGVQSKNLAQILENDKLRQLARASGIKLNNIASLSVPQVLIDNPILSTSNKNEDKPDKLDGSFIDLQQLNETTLTPIEAGQLFSQSSNNNHSAVNNLHKHILSKIQAVTRQRPIPDNILQNVHSKPSNPVAQVLNIPLKLGFPFIQLPFNSFNNFLSPHASHSSKPNLGSSNQYQPNSHFLQSATPTNSLSSSHKSLLSNLGSLSNLAPHFLQSIVSKKEKPSALYQALPVVAFPQGPRSFRSKRRVSQSPEVSVKKGFQVITSIDLSFSPNITTDVPEILEGVREDFVYGICVPTNGVVVALIALVSIVFLTLSSSFYFIKKLNKLNAKN